MGIIKHRELPGNQIARIKGWCEQGPQTFTEEALERFIGVPKRPDPLIQSLLVASGNRPAETLEEVIKHHCEIMGLMYWKTFDYRTLQLMHHFQLKQNELNNR
jgi:hypothetical protein